MPDACREPDDQELPPDLVKLQNVLEGLPSEYRERVDPVLERVVDSTRRRRKLLGQIQMAMTQMRLDVSYLLFDLEATRRERDAYRQRLD